MKKIFRYSLYLLIILLRFLLPIYFFKNHSVFLVVLITFLDAIDAEFAANHVVNKKWYQKMDKMLDLYWYTWLLTYVMVYYPNYALIFLVLFVYRAVGHVILLLGFDRKVLIYFPNFFEYLFFLFFFSNSYTFLSFLIKGNNFYYSLVGVIAFKFLQEYFLHVKKLSIRENILGLKRAWKV